MSKKGGHKKRSAAGARPTDPIRGSVPQALSDRLRAAVDFHGNRVTAVKKAPAVPVANKDGEKKSGGRRKGSSGH